MLGQIGRIDVAEGVELNPLLPINKFLKNSRMNCIMVSDDGMIFKGKLGDAKPCCLV